MALVNLQAFYQVAVLLTLTFKGNDILDLKLDNTARANKVRNTVILGWNGSKLHIPISPYIMFPIQVLIKMLKNGHAQCISILDHTIL